MRAMRHNARSILRPRGASVTSRDACSGISRGEGPGLRAWTSGRARGQGGQGPGDDAAGGVEGTVAGAFAPGARAAREGFEGGLRRGVVAGRVAGEVAEGGARVGV